ncbi:MAG: hypothetical protein ABW060_13355 [Solirubrobacteraceae bacterium]
MRRLVVLLLAALAAAVLIAPAAGAAERKVPFGFLGTMADGAFVEEPSIDLDAETSAMVRTGVERLRLAVYWDQAQPDPATAPDFAATERIVGAAARRGIPVFLTIVAAPAWARKDPSRHWSPPADPAAYGRFAGQVAARFGSRGTFWSEHPELPRVPVRDYQIWNEPAGFAPGEPSVFWDDKGEPYQQRYVAMLRAARQQVRAADPAANIVLAAFFGRAWQTMPKLLKAGADGLFDQFALNIFTARPGDLVRAARKTRKAMRRVGARRVPVVFTEVSWTASRGRLREGTELQTYDLTPKKQARRLVAAMTRLAAARKSLKIAGAFWYTWLSRYSSPTYRFDYAGLRRLDGGRVVTTRAQSAFRGVARTLEGCAKRAIRDC